MLEELKERVYKSNIQLLELGLVVFTWGNASAYDPESKLMVIKPSGIDYDIMQPEDMVVVNLEGQKIEGKYKPSSDTPTHIELYKAFKNIEGIVHTHSEWATSWAQAGRSIPPYGTTHADYFYKAIPCTRKLSKEEIESSYEKETGSVIIECFQKDNIDPIATPGVLVNGHAPFAWGKSVEAAVYHAKVIEEVAKMAFRNEALGNTTPIDDYLLEKHYNRKHGKNAYYGQQ
ncbi:MAG: L-ribulose-5-phosphate 4-epimerase [Cytophagales bacterium]|nr:MAG: L-ribulose-5-phosphate 4-epimerase [Cytophagales bacterium]